MYDHVTRFPPFGRFKQVQRPRFIGEAGDRVKKTVSVAIGFLLSFLFIYLAFRNVDVKKMFSLYKGVNYVWLIPFFPVWLAELSFRALRWRLLLLPTKETDFKTMFKLVTIGLALNNILPFRLGEIARGTLAAKNYDISYVSVFSTILVERALDAIILFTMFATFSYYGNLSGGLLNYGNYFRTLLGFLIAALLTLAFSDEVLKIRLFSGFFEKHPKIKGLFEKAAMGVRCFHDFKTATAVIIFACLQWFMQILLFYFMARAFSLHGVIDIFKSMALLFTAAVAVSVPSMPGYFGNLEFALSRVMSLWDIPRDTALAFAGASHVFGYLIVTLLGVFFIYGMGHSLTGLLKSFGGGKKS